jgi:hypothetical protein
MLCGSEPPLFRAWAEQEWDIEAIDPELASLRRIPIGRYFERLVQRWLSTRPGVSKLAASVPVRSGTTTLGELDFVFEAEGQCYHWELAIKFYLGTGDRLAESDWFGPQGRDRLDLKLDKLQAHQLRLLEQAEGQAVLQAHGLRNPQSFALVKGYLFHPFADWAADHRPTPPCVNRDHAHGWWIHLSKVSQICQRSARWRILEKQEWLAPAHGPGDIAAEELVARLQRYFDQDDRPPMLVAINEECKESERGFVVPDDWSPSPK